MILFLLRKSFLHYWDNLYTLLCVNLSLAMLGALSGYLASLQGGGILALVPVYLCNLLIGTTSIAARRVSDYDPPDVRLLATGVPTVWKDALFFTGCVALQGMVLEHVIPYYLTLGSRRAGLLLGMLLFLACAAWWVAMLHYYPARLRLNLPVLKAVHTAFLLFAANFSLSLAIFLLSAISLMLSLPSAMLLPGMSFVLLLHQVAGRTVQLKHRYLEGHPQATEAVPWNFVLKDDLEFLRGRSMRGIVFPWKE